MLVIGVGLGTEADAMADNNQVTCFELPGTLRDFAMRRLGERVEWLSGANLAEALCNTKPGFFDLIVAIDTLEHIHPAELDEALGYLGHVLASNGALYAHNNWGQQDVYPMHHDHKTVFDAWCERVGLVKVEGEACLWQRN